ncbi:MAG: non-hydrolyzing UDP-N-acetylglucosamine 2-epimerase [Candidatus Lokiarchaeia archaeon]
MKVLFVFGTRPEAIKMAAVIKEMEKYSQFDCKICITAQHREMLDDVLNLFNIQPDYDLNIMTDNQSLFEVTTRSLMGLKEILTKQKPDMVLMQGDTTTSFTASLAAFYLQIRVGHIEAGLRTYNKYSPFPEEKNRHLSAALTDYHFAHTEWAKGNLINEGISQERIWVTGNPGIDALLLTIKKISSPEKQEEFKKYFWGKWNLRTDTDKLILVTAHRRENFGKGLKNICLALKEIACKNPDFSIVYPVHPNPNVQNIVQEVFGKTSKELPNNTHPENIFLIEPLPYEPFVYLMERCYLVLTDSGGIQEEAPSLGKPVLVMRNTTERPEGVDAGTVKLVGANKDKIISETQNLLNNQEAYHKMSRAINPYGDGRAAQKIVEVLRGKIQ